MRSPVVVLGGGMAGAWAAYRLAKAGVGTVLVSYRGEERGGVQGSSRRSAGALNVLPMVEPRLEEMLQRMGRGQTHPAVAGALRKHFLEALEDFRGLVALKPIKLGYALESGGGEGLLRVLEERFQALGGTVVEGWVTRLEAGLEGCRGVQYERAGRIGKIRCQVLVIAAGGYSGLFKNAIRTHCFGNVLGLYLERGGWATNLEFLFKHGYGNIDANALTPTEELPGSEIYDRHHERVPWLEEALFQRMGTTTHLQAVQQWLRDPENEYYVDLSYRPLYLRMSAVQSAVEAGVLRVGEGGGWVGDLGALDGLTELFPERERAGVVERMRTALMAARGLEYGEFEGLKGLLETPVPSRFRVRPLTYFSMGGIGHRDFATNLRDVYVSGEAMHDFGANRVGGLPWSLYLASGCAVAERVAARVGGGPGWGEDFEVVRKPARFDGALLGAIQERLHDCQEREFTAARAMDCVAWFRERRRELAAGDAWLHDARSWLLVGEAILVSSLVRAESRGFFHRCDYREEDERMEGWMSCAWYDEATDTVESRLMPREAFAGSEPDRPWDKEEERIHGALA